MIRPPPYLRLIDETDFYARLRNVTGIQSGYNHPRKASWRGAIDEMHNKPIENNAGSVISCSLFRFWIRHDKAANDATRVAAAADMMRTTWLTIPFLTDRIMNLPELVTFRSCETRSILCSLYALFNFVSSRRSRSDDTRQDGGLLTHFHRMLQNVGRARAS